MTTTPPSTDRVHPARPTPRRAWRRVLSGVATPLLLALALAACGAPGQPPPNGPNPDPDPTPGEPVVRYALVTTLAVTEQAIAAYAVTGDGTWRFVDAAPLPSFSRGVVVVPDTSVAIAVSATAGGVATITRHLLGEDGRFGTPQPLGVPAPSDPRTPVLHPDGRALYLPSADGSVWSYALGEDGSLAPLAAVSPPPVAVDAPVTGFAVHPSGALAFATHAAADAVVTYAIAADGALTPIASPTLGLASGSAPFGIAVSPAGDTVHVTSPTLDRVIHLAVAADGSLSDAGWTQTPTGSQPGAIALDAEGANGYVAFATLAGGVAGFDIDESGGWSAHAGGPIATDPIPFRLFVDPGGRTLHVAPQGSGGVQHVAIAADGRLIPGARWPSPTRGIPTGVAFVHGSERPQVDGAFAYASVIDPFEIVGFDLRADPPTTLPGVATEVFGLAAHPSGRWLFSGTFVGVASFNVGANGALAPTIPPGIDDGTLKAFPAVDPAGRFLYAPETLGDRVTIYRIGFDGALSLVEHVLLGTNARPYTIAVHPSGRYVYVAAFEGASVYQFGVTLEGALTPLDPPTVPTATFPISLAMHPDGTSLHVGGTSLTRFTIADDGRLVPAAPPTIASIDVSRALAIDPLGRRAFAAMLGESAVFDGALDGDGLVVALGTEPLPFTARALAFDPNARRLYAGTVEPSTFAGYDVLDDGRSAPSAAFSIPLPNEALSIAVVPRWR